MAGDAYASDQEGASLSEEHLAIYWYFADSRSRRGIPTVTPTYAQRDFGWKWARVKAVMQEIEDAGFWKIASNGIPEFTPGLEPPTLKPLWAVDDEPELAAPHTHTQGACEQGVGPLAVPTAKSSKNTPQRQNPSGVLSSRRFTDGSDNPPIYLETKRSEKRLVRTVGRETYNLVDYFCYKVRKAHGGFAPGQLHLDALGANIKRWLAIERIPRATVMVMIDIFVEDYAPQKKGAPAWKLFIAQREKLYTRAKERLSSKDDSDYFKRRLAEVEEAGT